MGSLTHFLQDAFAAHCPKGWTCEAEVPLVGREAARRLGFAPRADVMLSEHTSQRRVFVEFEISRADPVANHAKFATASLLEGLGSDDCFVSMTSTHIVIGRAALSAGTTIWMRGLGIPAYQVDLLPSFDGRHIKELNSRSLTLQDDLSSIPVKEEILRVLDVSDAATTASGHRIHKADNSYTVGLNVRNWNAQVVNPAWAPLWGRRRIQYFVMDAASYLFAPAKFCAFIPGPQWVSLKPGTTEDRNLVLGMNLAIYSQLGEQDPRFDGNVARRHLQDRLGYRVIDPSSSTAEIRQSFESWAIKMSNFVDVRRDSRVLIR